VDGTTLRYLKGRTGNKYSVYASDADAGYARVVETTHPE
jgi:hypothetical protein